MGEKTETNVMFIGGRYYRHRDIVTFVPSLLSKNIREFVITDPKGELAEFCDKHFKEGSMSKLIEGMQKSTVHEFRKNLEENLEEVLFLPSEPLYPTYNFEVKKSDIIKYLNAISNESFLKIVLPMQKEVLRYGDELVQDLHVWTLYASISNGYLSGDFLTLAQAEEVKALYVLNLKSLCSVLKELSSQYKGKDLIILIAEVKKQLKQAIFVEGNCNDFTRNYSEQLRNHFDEVSSLSSSFWSRFIKPNHKKSLVEFRQNSLKKIKRDMFACSVPWRGRGIYFYDYLLEED